MSLAQMVIRLVAEARQYKADLSDAAQHTQKAAADMVQSTSKVQQASAALGDQLGVQRDISEKAGAAVAKMGSAGGVATASIAALAAGTAVYALAMYKANQETQRQADALTLTGNAAGLVSGQLNQMARDAAAQVNGQVGNMRSTMETLVASGRVSQESLGAVAKGVELVARFSGQSREAVAKDFAGMASDVTAWAAKHNEQYHYLTLDQYKYIESLQKAGDVQGAMKANMDALAKSMGGDLTKNLGTLQKLWHGVGTWASWAWDKMLGWGREKSGSEKLDQLAKDLEFLQGKKYQNNDDVKRIAAIKERMNLQREENAQEIKAATEKAAIAAKGEADIKKYRDDQKVKGAKVDPNREIDAEIAALKAGEAAKAEIVKQGLDTIASERKRGVISESDALQQTVALQLQALGDKRATVEAELELSKKKTNSRKEQAALEGQIAALEEQQRTIAIKYGNDYFEMLAKGNLAAAEAHYKYIDSLEKGLAKMQQDAAAQDEHNARLGLGKQAIAELDAEKLRSQAVTLELMAIKQLDKNLDEAQYRVYIAQAKALRDLADAKQTGAAKEAGIDAEKAIAEEARRTAETIERTLTDALMRGFEAGKSFAVNMRDAVVNLFKTLVLRPLIQGVVGGVLGLPGAASANGTGTGGGGSSISSMVSAGKSAMNNMGWLTDFQGSATNGISKIGGQIGGEFGQSIITNAPAIGEAMSNLGDGLGYLNAAVAASKGEWGKALGSAIGTYFGGPIGAAIGSYVGSFVDGMAGGPTKPSIEGGYASAGTQGSANGKNYTNGVYGGALDNAAKGYVDGIVSAYGSVTKMLGAKAGNLTAQSFIGFDGNGGSKGSQNALSVDAQLNGKWVYNRWTDNGGSVGAGTTSDAMSAAQDLSSKKVIIEALKATDLGPALNEYLATVTTQGKNIEEINAVLADVTAVGSFKAAIKELPFDNLTAASVASVKALAEAAGGMSNLQAQLGSYYSNFYSESERAALTTKSVTAALGDVGISMPKTRAEFRSIVDSLDLNTASGQKTYTAMMATADAFASVTPAATNTAEAVEITAQAMLDAKKKLDETNAGWQDKINLLKGTTTQDEISKRNDLAAATDANTHLIDASTKALIDEYYARLKLNKMAAATTASMAAVLKDGMLGKIKQEDFGGAIADAIGTGIQTAIASSIADQIANAFSASIITPIIDAVIKGAAISSAVSQATIDGAIASATKSMQAITALMNDPGFQAVLNGIKSGFGGSNGTPAGNTYSPSAPNTGTFGGSGVAVGGQNGYQDPPYVQLSKPDFYKQQHERLDAEAAQWSAYLGKTIKLAFHLASDDALAQKNSLQAELDKLTGTLTDETQRRKDERYIIDDVNLALYDRVQKLKDEANATALLKDSKALQLTWQEKLDVLQGKTTDSQLQQARELAEVDAHEKAAKDQLLYVTDAVARATLQQSIATDEATKAIIGQVYAQQQAAQVAAERQSWQDKLDILQGKTTDRALQLQRDLASTTDAATKALILQVYAQQDLATAAATAAKGVDTAMSGLQRSVDAQKKIVQAQLQVANESVNTLNTIFDNLKSNVADLYGQVSSTASASAGAGQAFIANALANAQTTGYLPDSTALADAISAARKGIDGTQYTSQYEADRARLVLAGQLDQLKTLSKSQLTSAQQAAKDAQTQIDALDKIVSDAQTQISALRGIDTSVLSVQAAIDRLAAAILAEKATSTTGTGAAGTGTGAGTSSNPLAAAAGGGFANLGAAQKALLGNAVGAFASDNFKSASDAQKAALAAGSASSSIFVTTASALSALNSAADSTLTAAGNVSKYLTLATGSTLSMADRTAYNYGQISANDLLHKYNIPGYAVGTPFVPEDGLAYLHRGEAVVPAQYNGFNRFNDSPAAGSKDTARLESLVEALTAEVSRLRGRVEDGNRHAKRTADGVNGQGEAPIRTKAIA